MKNTKPRGGEYNMPRISESTRKWQKRLEEVERHRKQMMQAHNVAVEENVKLKAKLERFEATESKQDQVDFGYRAKLEEEVGFLRDLVRDMMISPEIIKAHAKNEIRKDEARQRYFLREEKASRVRENHEAQMAKLQTQQTNCRPEIKPEL